MGVSDRGAYLNLTSPCCSALDMKVLLIRHGETVDNVKQLLLAKLID